jgi:hypothetical protein
MDGIALGLYVAATFFGGFTSGLTGFASVLIFRHTRLTSSLPTSPANIAARARHTRRVLVPAR